jgi:hypothetical protein
MCATFRDFRGLSVVADNLACRLGHTQAAAPYLSRESPHEKARAPGPSFFRSECTLSAVVCSRRYAIHVKFSAGFDVIIRRS